jgi:DNA-binding CsgD family transcriptional regulator
VRLRVLATTRTSDPDRRDDVTAVGSAGGAVRALASFVDDVHARILAGDPRTELLGSAFEAAEAMADLAARTTSTLWNAQPRYSMRTIRQSRGLDEATRRRGVAVRFVTSSAATRHAPLMTSYAPFARIAPVTQPLIVADGRIALVAGPPGTSDEPTIWAVTEPRVVARAVRVYDDLWRAATPAVPEGEEPPFTPRMVELGMLLVDGATDRQIAERLNVSQRTVSNEVRELIDRLGATNRTHAIALIAGANA